MRSHFIACTTSVQISFTFTSRTWSMSSPDLIYGTTDPTGEYCMGSLFEIQAGSSSTVQWIIGQPFLVSADTFSFYISRRNSQRRLLQKNVYTVLRYNPAAVGFAQLSGVDGSLPFPDTSGVSFTSCTDTSG